MLARTLTNPCVFGRLCVRIDLITRMVWLLRRRASVVMAEDPRTPRSRMEAEAAAAAAGRRRVRLSEYVCVYMCAYVCVECACARFLASAMG